MTERHLHHEPGWTRRLLLRSAAATALCTLAPASLHGASDAGSDATSDAVRGHFGEAVISEGRITLKLPALAENGNSVEMTVEAASPMTEADYVESITIFAGKNPVPLITVFHFGPHSALARATTRIRLADSQTVTAVARMSDGSLWSGSARTVVTLAACLDLT